MNTVTLPKVPLVPVAASERSTDTLPPPARALYERRSCTLLEAVEFLGTLKVKVRADGTREPGAAAYAKAKAYTTRTGPIKARPPYDPNLLLPRIVDGEVVEIPCMKIGGYVVDTRLLVWCRYPQVSPW